MRIDIPKTSTVSHELPLFTELSNETKLPISEIKARFRQEIIEQHRKAMEDPSSLPMNADENAIIDLAVESLQTKLANPEEVVDEDKEYNDLFNLEPGEQDPAAQQFNIDNMDLGFSDDGMSSLDGISDQFDDFGSVESGDDVNAISDIEPGSTDEETDDTFDFDDLGDDGFDFGEDTGDLEDL